MNTQMRSGIDRALAWSPAQAAFRWRASRSLAVLAYHGVDDPDRFARHLDDLVRDWQPVSLDETVRAAHAGTGLPRRAVLLTFDDGDRSILKVALPALRERGIPAVAFVVAGLLDTEQPLWWKEVEILMRSGTFAPELEGLETAAAIRRMKRMSNDRRERVIEDLRRASSNGSPRADQLRAEELPALQSGGIAIGNHSLTHPCLSTCNRSAVADEIGEAHDALERALGNPPVAFAYPDGDEDPRARPILEELGYLGAFLFDHRRNPVPVRDPLAISRLRIDSTATIERFRTILSGLHPAVHRMRGGS